jgi:hypothetical protein
MGGHASKGRTRASHRGRAESCNPSESAHRGAPLSVIPSRSSGGEHEGTKRSHPGPVDRLSFRLLDGPAHHMTNFTIR